MEEEISIKISSNKCKKCSNDCKRRLEDKILCELRNNLTPKLNYKQLPETFEELKDLCKDIKERLNKEIWKIEIEKEFIYIRKKWETEEICFTSIGNILSNNGWNLLMTNLTSVQMYRIIKNLIGKD